MLERSFHSSYVGPSVHLRYLVSEKRADVYSGRGFSRSYLDGAQDYEHRIETDIDDAARLIKHISPQEPATVIGNSSGAIVALKLLIRYPDIIRTLVPYEPPAAKLLPDFDELWAQHQDVYDTYRRSGIPPALEKFAKVTQADQRMLVQMIDPRNGQYLFSNTQYWFEREFMYYPKTDFDIEKELRPLKDKLLLVNGELSPREAYQYRASAALAERLELKVVHLPGEHVGHATHAQEFSQQFLEALKAKDKYYANVWDSVVHKCPDPWWLDLVRHIEAGTLHPVARF